MTTAGVDPELASRLAEVEAEVAQLEQELQRRRDEALSVARARVTTLTAEVERLEAHARSVEAQVPVIGKKAMQAQARHELQRAMASTRRSPFPGLRWLPGTSLAIGLAVFAFTVSAPWVCLTLPGGALAYRLGKERADE